MILSLILNVYFIATSSKHSPWAKSHDPSLLFYSPVNDLIEYQTVKFYSSNPGPGYSPWQGPPSPEKDKLWIDLFEYIGITAIDKASADQLPEATTPIPGHEEQYVVELDVFHQLHCLNNIRMSYYPEYYNLSMWIGDTPEAITVHLDHCIDQLRQYIQCHADVTPMVWQWSEADNQYLTDTGPTHSCRNFEKIQAWAQEHATKVKFDTSIYVPGSPVWATRGATSFSNHQHGAHAEHDHE